MNAKEAVEEIERLATATERAREEEREVREALVAALRAAAGQLESAVQDFAALVEVTEACFSTNAIRSRQGSTLAKLAAINSERAANQARAALQKAGAL